LTTKLDFPFVYLGKKILLIDYLTFLQPETFWRSKISNGHVLVWERFVGEGFWLQKGDCVSFQAVVSEPEIDRQIKVLFEDADFLAVDKSPTIPIHPTGAYRNHTLVGILEKDFGKVYPVHRLDRETSGIVLLAKSGEIASLFLRDLSQFKKNYFVGVVGRFEKSRRIAMNLGPKPGSLVRIRQGENPAGQFSATRFRPVCRKTSHTLCVAVLETGRKHQIRAQLAESGYPVIGDKIYGRNEQAFVDFTEGKLTSAMTESLGHTRQFLHCYRMTFRHPRTRKTLVIKSGLPDDLQNVWNRLN
jgi:RluA family pseudouridine synthase